MNYTTLDNWAFVKPTYHLKSRKAKRKLELYSDLLFLAALLIILFEKTQ